MDRTLTVRIDDDLDRDLDREARRLRQSKGEVVRDALRKRLSADKPCAYDLLKPLDGIVKRGPRDLSTNKAHLAGFGRSRRHR